MFVSCTVFLLSGRGLCDGPIPRPEESYQLWCVSECDQVKIKTFTLTVNKQVEEGGTANIRFLIRSTKVQNVQALQIFPPRDKISIAIIINVLFSRALCVWLSTFRSNILL
jgi:hypothetical protein